MKNVDITKDHISLLFGQMCLNSVHLDQIKRTVDLVHIAYIVSHSHCGQVHFILDFMEPKIFVVSLIEKFCSFIYCGDSMFNESI